MRARIVLASIAGVLVATSTGIAADTVLRPDSGPWETKGAFSFATKPKKTRQALSGIACPLPQAGEQRCLAAFDEGGEARHLVLRDGVIEADPKPIVLRPGGVELDAEGAATDGTYYYVTGSHSAKRSDCANNPESRYVIRIRLDPASNRVPLTAAGEPVGLEPPTGRLWQIMSSLPELAPHVGDGMCLGTEPPEKAKHLKGKRGVNIEGLAVRDGRLFFGFRGPAQDGVALVLAVDSDAFFSDRDAKPTVSKIEVGKGRAIRDMLAVSDGILILAGPDDDGQDTGWTVVRWDGRDTGGTVFRPAAAARLDLRDVKLRDCDDELKPEALAVLEDRPGAPYRAVILSDGMCDGGPLAFTIPR